jgi:CheY-like chemotaxis protein
MLHKRILIIDDEDDVREVASLALEISGDFEVATADGGLAGLKAAREGNPDIILLDVMMPEVDGPSTFRLLKQLEDTRSIPVIFVTAKVRASDRSRLTELGALGIIAKPFDPMRLADDVAAIAGW